ncbi:MAG: hypothetical protein GTO02_16755, partial [Candidatus Dadabacteria bacterium]|nr:hypothetical protein [Candidatus Dadabacteria bacterium]
CNICHTNVVNPEIGRLASPIKRLGAYFLDLIVPVVVIVIISGGVSESSKNQIDDDTTAMFASGVILIYAVVALILFARGTTIGKRMLGMWVIKEDGKRAGFFTMLIREVVGKFISGFVLLLGY